VSPRDTLGELHLCVPQGAHTGAPSDPFRMCPSGDTGCVPQGHGILFLRPGRRGV